MNGYTAYFPIINDDARSSMMLSDLVKTKIG